MSRVHFCIVCFFLVFTSFGKAQEVYSISDMEGFLKRQNPIWNTLPNSWEQAPFLGNGMLGIQFYQTDEHTLRIDVGRGDVQDHRLPVRGRMNDRCRLPVGYFELNTKGKVTGGNLTLNIWDATLYGKIETESDSIELSAYVHAEKMVIVIDTTATGMENTYTWNWHPHPAVSPRWTHRPKHFRDDYQTNPAPNTFSNNGINICEQSLFVGGETATAWKEQTTKSGSKELIVSIEHSFPEKTAKYQAFEHVKTAAETISSSLHKTHRLWWQKFYSQSFVSIPDPYWESFYWIQMYKLASATRADRMLIDNQGPWLQPTGWPGAWWNLNVQLSYWPTITSNHHQLGYSLPRVLKENAAALIMTVPEAYRYDSAALARSTGQQLWGQEITEPGDEKPETGHLTWALHNCWLLYRHTMDEELLRETIFPLLRRSINYYLHFLEEDKNGTLHLPQTWSPEYKGIASDCNYDLALIRWGCETLLKSVEILELRDPLIARWREVLDSLTPPPQDESGLLIAKNLPLSYGHRHYSHLLSIYPLYLLNSDQPEAEELMQKSLEHWFQIEGDIPGRFAGYSYTGAASISAAFGRGNDALDYLNLLKPRILPNTLYSEGRETRVPVIETPLSAAQSIHDMYLQSWGNTIRIFPAMPDAWSDAVFHNFSAEGGFVISAKRENGNTRWVRIKSIAGEPVAVEPNLPGVPRFDSDYQDRIVPTENPKKYTLHLKAGEEITLWADTPPRNFKISSVNRVDGVQKPIFGLP